MVLILIRMSNNPFLTESFENTSNDSHGCVIIFPDHMTKEQCNDLLKRMFKAGYCKANYKGEAPTCHAFNPDHGSPTWYVP